MNLRSTIEIYAGGPGSGCNGPNCGRPSVAGDKKAQSVMQEANRSIIKEWRHKLLGGVKNAKDINYGLCDVWADHVSARLPGAEKEVSKDGEHVAVRYKGKLYDSETHEGVSTWDDLPFMRANK